MNGRMSDTGDDDRGRAGNEDGSDRTERQKGGYDMRLLAIPLKGPSRHLGIFPYILTSTQG